MSSVALLRLHSERHGFPEPRWHCRGDEEILSFLPSVNPRNYIDYEYETNFWLSKSRVDN